MSEEQSNGIREDLRAAAMYWELQGGIPQETTLEWKAAEYVSSLEREIADLKSGRTAIIPQTREHAENLLLVAEGCIKSFRALANPY